MGIQRQAAGVSSRPTRLSSGTSALAPGCAFLGTRRARFRSRWPDTCIFPREPTSRSPAGARRCSVSDVTDGTVRGTPSLVVGGLLDKWIIWAANVGPEFRQQQTISLGQVKQGSMLQWGAGAGVLVLNERRLQLGVESSGALTFESVQQHTTNLELLFGGRYRFRGNVEIGLAAGPGLTSGVGTPDYRGVLSAAYAPKPKPTDRDHDGVADEKDACPDTAGVYDPDPHKNGCPRPQDWDHDGVMDAVDACPDVAGVADPDPRKNGCPPPKDRDGDGIPDAEDACPDVKGVRTPDVKTNGCPADWDGDGISDGEDACPEVKGLRTPDLKTNGCPADTDADGIPDNEDACPKEKGPADPDPKKNGCPHLAILVRSGIKILEQVQFTSARAVIQKTSDGLLDEVAAVLKQHPEVGRIEIQGFSDNRGPKRSNVLLSQARADAVMSALVGRGVDKRRLTARGYGPDRPVESNDTEVGRQRNRRVEFTVPETGIAKNACAQRTGRTRPRLSDGGSIPAGHPMARTDPPRCAPDPADPCLGQRATFSCARRRSHCVRQTAAASCLTKGKRSPAIPNPVRPSHCIEMKLVAGARARLSTCCP